MNENRIKRAAIGFMVLVPLIITTLGADHHEWVAVACGLALFIATMHILVAERRSARAARV